MIFSKNGRLKIVFRQSGGNLKGVADTSRQLARFSLAVGTRYTGGHTANF